MAFKKREKIEGKKLLLTKEMAHDYAREYSEISKQIKTLEDRKKSLSNALKEYAVANGTKDDKGSSYYDFDDYVVGSVAKTKLIPRDNIIDLLKNMGREDCVDMIEAANMTMIDKLHDEGVITDEQVESLYELKPMSASISVIKKEEMPEVQKAKAALSKRRV